MPIVPCAPYLPSQRCASPGRQQAHEEMYEGRTTTGVTIHPACQSTHAAVPPQSTLLSTVGNFPGKRRPSARVGLDKTMCGGPAAVGLSAHAAALPPYLCRFYGRLGACPHAAPGQ